MGYEFEISMVFEIKKRRIVLLQWICASLNGIHVYGMLCIAFLNFSLDDAFWVSMSKPLLYKSCAFLPPCTIPFILMDALLNLKHNYK